MPQAAPMFALSDVLSALAMLMGSGVVVWLFKLVAKLAVMETTLTNNRRDLDILLSFIYNRAKTELVFTGLAKPPHSPIELTVNCVEAVMPFLSKFIPFYAQVLKKYPTLTGDALDKKMFMEFEEAFGEFITEKICIPMHVNQGACLLAIIKSCQNAMRDVKPKDVDPFKDFPEFPEPFDPLSMKGLK